MTAQAPDAGTIQRARDVLAKARMMLTAGNLDLLDAIDGLLATALVQQAGKNTDHAFQTSASLVAAAIIAADERMSA